MEYTCTITQRTAQPSLSIRGRTPVAGIPDFFDRSYGALVQYLNELGQPPAGAAYAAYHNMDMEDLDTEVGFPVSQPLPGRGEIQTSEIPGGSQASVIHTGPYDQLGAAYQALAEFIQAGGYTPTGIAYEIYLNDPRQTPAEELQTLIFFPLKG